MVHRDEHLRRLRSLLRRDRIAAILGVRRVTKQDPFATPATREAIGGINPRFASRNRERLRRAKAEYQSWLAWYYDALERFNQRGREAVFPSGIWKMRAFHKVNCASEPP